MEKNERRAHLNCVYSNQKLHKSYTVRKYVTKDGQGLYSIHVSSDGGDWRRWRAKDNVDSTEKEVAFILLVDRFLAGRFGSREDIISFIASKV